MHTELESWAEAIRMAPRRLLLPWTRAPRVPRIRMLRVLTLLLGGYLVFLVLVLLFLVDVPGGYPVGWLYGWAGVTAGSLSLGYWIRNRRTERFLLTSNRKTAHRLYTSRMFASLAIAEIPALVGFVICFLIDSLLPYLVALPVTVYLMFRDGPSARDVHGLQEMLDEYQDPYDIAAVLMQTPPSRPT